MRALFQQAGQGVTRCGATVAMLLCVALLSGCKATGEDLKIADLREIIENPPTLAALGLQVDVEGETSTDGAPAPNSGDAPSETVNAESAQPVGSSNPNAGPSSPSAPPVAVAAGSARGRTNVQSDPSIPGSRVADPVAIEPETDGDSFEDTDAAVPLPRSRPSRARPTPLGVPGGGFDLSKVAADIGAGDVLFTKLTRQHFEEYLAAPSPGFFLVSTEGDWSEATWCDRDGCAEEDLPTWLESCGRPLGEGQRCWVFAYRGEIVWRQPGAFLLQSDWLDTPTAESTELIGPDQAEGIVLYLPGYDPGRLIQTTRHVPPYLRRMNEAGLDIVRLNYPSHRVRVAGYPLYLRQVADGYRQQGYRRVFVAGQGMGAWIALVAATEPAHGFDGIIAAAPAAAGRFATRYNRRRAAGTRFLNNLELAGLIENVRGTRLVIALFTGDPESGADVATNDEPARDDRGGGVREALSRVNLDGLVLDNPSYASGHYGAWTVGFDYGWGDCIRTYLFDADPDSAATCVVPGADDHRALMTVEDIPRAADRRLDAEAVRALLINRIETMTSYEGGYTAQIRYAEDGRYVGRDASAGGRAQRFTGRWKVEEDGRFCIRDQRVPEISCSTLYRWRDGIYLDAAEDGRLTGWTTYRKPDNL